VHEELLARERAARAEAEARGRRIAAQYAVSEVLAAAPGFAEAIPAILRTLGEHLEWQFVGCWCRSKGGDVLRSSAFWRAPRVDAAALERANRELLFVRGDGLPGRVWAAGEAEWVNADAKARLPRRAAVVASGFQTAFAFPIRSAAEIFGVIELFHRESREPDAELLQTASAIGNQIGQFIERKRAERQLIERTRQAALGADVGAAATESGTLPEALRRCADAVVRHLDAALCRIWTCDERTRVLVLEAEEGIAADTGDDQRRVPLGVRAVGRIGERRQPELRAEVERDPDVGDPAWLEREGLRSFAGFPLVVEDRLVGVVAMLSRQPLGEGRVEALHSVADRVALVIDRKWREEELRRTAEAQRLLAEEREGLRRAEQAAREAAEAANRAKLEFLTTMSHELRTPLNAIAGYAELLWLGVHGPVTDAQREALERIRRSERHLLSLINDILNFARLEAGHAGLTLSAVRLRPLLEELEVLVQPLMRERSHHYEYAPCDATLSVRADAERLSQIVLNLLTNAIKFTERGGTIRLGCERVGDRVAIHVSDSGVGIAAADLARIFDPFVQLGRSLTSGHHGTGLGLAISRDLAHAMRGDLTVESEVGRGSRFTLALPAA
jgi:signal transduction histidine kinase